MFSKEHLFFQTISGMVKKLLKLPDGVKNLMALVGMGIGLLLLVPEIIFWIRSCFVPKKAKEADIVMPIN